MPVSRQTIDILNADGTQVIEKSALLDAGYAQSGSLTQPSFSTGVAQILSTTRNLGVHIAVTNTTIAGTAAIALSPDNSTFTTVQTLTSGVNASVLSTMVLLPAGWALKITFTNATVVVTQV